MTFRNTGTIKIGLDLNRFYDSKTIFLVQNIMCILVSTSYLGHWIFLLPIGIISSPSPSATRLSSVAWWPEYAPTFWYTRKRCEEPTPNLHWVFGVGVVRPFSKKLYVMTFPWPPSLFSWHRRSHVTDFGAKRCRPLLGLLSMFLTRLTLGRFHVGDC